MWGAPPYAHGGGVHTDSGHRERTMNEYLFETIVRQRLDETARRVRVGHDLRSLTRSAPPDTTWRTPRPSFEVDLDEAPVLQQV